MAHVTLHNAAGYAQDIKARIHQLKSDEPESNGGKDTGPAPMSCCWPHWPPAPR
jgi:putative redox protein